MIFNCSKCHFHTDYPSQWIIHKSRKMHLKRSSEKYETIINKGQFELQKKYNEILKKSFNEVYKNVTDKITSLNISFDENELFTENLIETLIKVILSETLIECPWCNEMIQFNDKRHVNWHIY